MPQKYSRQREAIKENLMKRKDHPTADMIYSDIRMIHPNVSLGTVYRNLSLLASQGEIIKISCEDGGLRYDGNTKPHGHFICRSCGRVTDMELADAEEIKKRASDAYAGDIDDCVVTFYGRCEYCVG